ncbi:MAG: pilin [Patescibacteria group bacterium]|nr:pilin [Patescibacteria group bacterium]
MKKIIVFLTFSLLLVAPVAVSADALGAGLLNESVGKSGLSNDLQGTAANIISSVLAVIGTIFLVLTIAAGVMWMTAGGNEEKITKARNIIVAAVIGLIIVLSAYTITYFVGSRLSGAAGGQGSPNSTQNSCWKCADSMIGCGGAGHSARAGESCAEGTYCCTTDSK